MMSCVYLEIHFPKFNHNKQASSPTYLQKITLILIE